MKSNLGRALDQLQRQVEADSLEKYGRRVIERWENPPHKGMIDNPSCRGKKTGSCGDSMEIFLRIQDGRIMAAGFVADGCGSSQVAASACCELSMGRTLEDAMSIDKNAVLELLGGLPDDDAHCAHLAAKTLEDAIHDWMTRFRNQAG
ncbi:MAG: iron-sulfur cluster assembly scaffold protein [Desulfovibrionaceae bacterium]|nr:iron-sulfur cluster assembly scaffold protein [Desulfovibrionaceae bacterium]